MPGKPLHQVFKGGVLVCVGLQRGFVHLGQQFGKTGVTRQVIAL